MLEVIGLGAGYGTARVLEDVSLSVSRGESVALLGRNGMGKTTLIHAICGLQPPQLTSGSIELFGTSLRGLSSHRIARLGIGLVPQGRRVFGSLTVEENLRIVARGDGGAGWSIARVFDFFPRLRDRRLSFARSLSGGEQQMLAIGRALMTNPKLLIMDEPSEGLAPAVLDVIQDRLQEIRDSGMGVFVAEQNVDLALGLSDRVFILGEHGSIAWESSSDALRADQAPIHRHLGI